MLQSMNSPSLLRIQRLQPAGAEAEDMKGVFEEDHQDLTDDPVSGFLLRNLGLSLRTLRFLLRNLGFLLRTLRFLFRSLP